MIHAHSNWTPYSLNVLDMSGVYQFLPILGAVRGVVSSLQSKSKGQWQPFWPCFGSIEVRLHYGPVASDTFENKGLLTEQALPLSLEKLDTTSQQWDVLPDTHGA